MNFKRFWPLVLFAQAPLWMGLNKEKWQKIEPKGEKKVVIRHSCKDQQSEERLEKNSKLVRDHADSLGIKVDDQRTGFCGYELVHGSKNQRIPSDASGDQVLSEITAFFPKKK